MRPLVWRGLDVFRAEIAHVEVTGDTFSARGTQIGLAPEPYELRYELEAGERLRVQVVGGASLDLPLGEADSFDLGFSPLFNSLPVLRYGLHRGGDARELTMAFVSVPDLSVSRSQQRYVPLSRGRVRYRAGSFTAELELDPDGFVARYPQLAERVHPAGEELDRLWRRSASSRSSARA